MIEAEDPARELLVRYCLLVTCSIRLFPCRATARAGVRVWAAPYRGMALRSTPDREEYNVWEELKLVWEELA